MDGGQWMMNDGWQTTDNGWKMTDNSEEQQTMDDE